MVARKPPKAELAQAIVAKAKALDRAQLEFEEAIVAALRAGASARLTSEVAGVSYNTVVAIAKRHGWPDASERKRRADEAAERRKWRDQVDEFIRDQRP